MQIFLVRQDRSWTLLNLSRSLFEELVGLYEVFQPFWRHVFTFGRKSKENNFDFPNFQHRNATSNGTTSLG